MKRLIACSICMATLVCGLSSCKDKGVMPTPVKKTQKEEEKKEEKTDVPSTAPETPTSGVITNDSITKLLRKILGDGTIRELPYRLNPSCLQTLRERQKAALEEIKDPNNIFDPGGPAQINVRFSPLQEWDRVHSPEQTAVNGELFNFVIGQNDHTAPKEAVYDESKAPEMRIALVNEQGIPVLCSSTFLFRPDRYSGLEDMPIYLDNIPEGRYTIQLYTRNREKGETRWTKEYYSSLWEDSAIAHEAEAARRGVRTGKGDKAPEEWYPFDKEDYHLTVKNPVGDTPYFGDWHRSYRNAQGDLKCYGRDSIKVSPEHWENRIATYSLLLRNHSDRPIKGKIFARQYGQVECKTDERIFGWKHINYSRVISDLYDIEIPSHKELVKVFEFSPYYQKLGREVYGGGGRFFDYLQFYFIPDGETMERARPLLYDNLDAINLIVEKDLVWADRYTYLPRSVVQADMGKGYCALNRYLFLGYVNPNTVDTSNFVNCSFDGDFLWGYW